jgi:dihydroorotase-like cyclic amidohydrolase
MVGIIGLEMALGLALEQLDHPGHVDVADIVRLFTRNSPQTLLLDQWNVADGGPEAFAP